MYGINDAFCEQKVYINKQFFNNEIKDCNVYVKIIFSVLLTSGKRVVIKILLEENDPLTDRNKIEKQSEFSEFMRKGGIKTPKRYIANERYCNEYIYNNIPCSVTVEDWCGEEITEINTELSYKIGELLARMHMLSLDNKCEIGYKILFSAAYENDVDAFDAFCKICANEHIDQSIVEQIKKLRNNKLEAIRSVWSELPRAATQGDISINNLVDGIDGLIVFDYNNAGDEVLVSDLVLEGLLTAYEMDLPEGADKSCRKDFFPSFLNGYLSVRKLSDKEADTSWEIYTLYNSLWFSRILYNEDSLEKLIDKKDYTSANSLLTQMLDDMTEQNDGRFKM